MNTDLGSVITNPVARKVIYGAYTVANVVLIALIAGFGADAPAWLDVFKNVVIALGVPVGGLAVANTVKSVTGAPEEPYEEGFEPAHRSGD